MFFPSIDAEVADGVRSVSLFRVGAPSGQVRVACRWHQPSAPGVASRIWSVENFPMAGETPGGGPYGAPGAVSSKDPAPGKTPPRKTPFQKSHAVSYGLRVSSLGLDGKAEAAEFRFCVIFGRDKCMVGRKRKRTERSQHWTAPFRPENYRRNHKAQHSKSGKSTLFFRSL